MVQKRETKAINKLCVHEILSLSFVCAYFFEFRGRNLVCFVIAYNFNGKYAPEAGKTRMCTAFFTRAVASLEESGRIVKTCTLLMEITKEGAQSLRIKMKTAELYLKEATVVYGLYLLTARLPELT